MSSAGLLSKSSISREILDHLLRTVSATRVDDEPYSHFYLENVFPDDIYLEMMEQMPDGSAYQPLSEKNHRRSDGMSTRNVLPLQPDQLRQLRPAQRELWQGISTALAAPEVKTAVFRKLATDLSRRFGVERRAVDKITSFCKPSLFQDLEGYEIAPHTDGRSKIVTMQIYLPPDRSQIDLGTAVYRRGLSSVRNVLSWHGRFQKVKQFAFLPNSGYAFAVSNSLGKKSWHGREALPPGSGVRNSILNIFFASGDRNY